MRIEINKFNVPQSQVTPRNPKAHLRPEVLTAKKIVTVAFFGFLLASLYIQKADALGVAVGTVGVLGLARGLKAGECPVPLQTFAPILEQAVHPGFIATTQGDILCKIPSSKKMFTQKECDRIAALMSKDVQKRDRENYDSIVNQRMNILDGSKRPIDDKGFTIGIASPGISYPGASIEKVSIGVTSAKLKNYKQALTYLKKAILEKDRFFETASTKEVIETVQKTHAIMLRHVSDVQPGQFRTYDLVITSDHVDKTYEGFKKELLANGGTKSEVTTLTTLLRAIDRGEKRAEDLRKEINPILAKIGFLAAEHEKISSEMEAFAGDLKTRVEAMRNGEEDVVEVAAWVHQEIGRIGPFEEGNGRVARAWMNTILQLGGEKGVIFPDDAAYTQAIIQEQRGKGSFAAFLREMIVWTEENANLRDTIILTEENANYRIKQAYLTKRRAENAR